MGDSMLYLMKYPVSAITMDIYCKIGHIFYGMPQDFASSISMREYLL